MPYTVSAEADEDYFALYRIGKEQFGVAQADKYAVGLERVFKFLGDFPQAARERGEIDPPVRAHPTGSHVLTYQVETDGSVTILRIRHMAEDWTSNPL